MQPVYEALFGFHVFGLGFVTSMAFIIGTGERYFPLHRDMMCGIHAMMRMQPISQWLAMLGQACLCRRGWAGCC